MTNDKPLSPTKHERDSFSKVVWIKVWSKDGKHYRWKKVVEPTTPKILSEVGHHRHKVSLGRYRRRFIH